MLSGLKSRFFSRPSTVFKTNAPTNTTLSRGFSATSRGYESLDSVPRPKQHHMDQINKASEGAYETISVGHRQYRRVKPEYTTTKVAQPRKGFVAASSASSTSIPWILLLILYFGLTSALFGTIEGATMDDEPDTCVARIEPEPTQYEVKQTSTGFMCDLPVDPAYYTSIIGRKGETVSKIRTSTGCNVSVPARDSTATTIRIVGPSAVAVEEAIKGVLYIVNTTELGKKEERPKQVKYDFFVSLPLLDSKFGMELAEFHKDVKDLIAQKKISMAETALMKASSLHFTICMLHLHSPARVNMASELLESLASEIRTLANNKPIEVDWSQLRTFEDSKPTRADIIYMEPGEKARAAITPIAELIRAKFQEAGLTEVEGGKSSPEKLVLHATIANSRPNKFDATPMMALHSAKFSPVSAPEIHLSQRFSYDKNGYYHCASKLVL